MTSKVKGTEGIEFPDATVQGSAAYSKAQSDGRTGAVVASQVDVTVGVTNTPGNYISPKIDGIGGQSCMVGVVGGSVSVYQTALITGNSAVVDVEVNNTAFLQQTLTFPSAGTYLVTVFGMCSSFNTTIRNVLEASAVRIS